VTTELLYYKKVRTKADDEALITKPYIRYDWIRWTQGTTRTLRINSKWL